MGEEIHSGQIWGLATCPVKGNEDFFISGGYDNVVKMWDASLRKVVDTFEFVSPAGEPMGEEIHKCAWSCDGKYIACGTTSSRVYLLTWETSDDKGKKGARELKLAASVYLPPKEGRDVEEVAYLRFSPRGSELAVAHMDANLYIFSIFEPAETESNRTELALWKPMPHRAAPTHVQWSTDCKYVKTFTRDYEVTHYHIDVDERQSLFEPYLPDPDETQWAEDPIIAGWDVQGCYMPEWDGTDLNDVTVSKDGKSLISGDDFGLVRIHNYPAIQNVKSAHLAYNGHSSFVVGLEMLRNDEFLVTCGGNDMAVFQWKYQTRKEKEVKKKEKKEEGGFVNDDDSDSSSDSDEDSDGAGNMVIDEDAFI